MHHINPHFTHLFTYYAMYSILLRRFTGKPYALILRKSMLKRVGLIYEHVCSFKTTNCQTNRLYVQIKTAKKQNRLTRNKIVKHKNIKYFWQLLSYSYTCNYGYKLIDVKIQKLAVCFSCWIRINFCSSAARSFSSRISSDCINSTLSFA